MIRDESAKTIAAAKAWYDHALSGLLFVPAPTEPNKIVITQVQTQPTNPLPSMKSATAMLLAILALGLSGCVTTQTPSTSNTTSSGPAVVTISSLDLGLIQTAATVATGAVLQFTESNSADRTNLANQIYSSANAAYSLSTGNIPSATQINSTILSFAGSNPASNYSQYASALSGIYSAALSKFGVSGKNAVAILGAVAQGAQAAASAYTSVNATATP